MSRVQELLNGVNAKLGIAGESCAWNDSIIFQLPSGHARIDAVVLRYATHEEALGPLLEALQHDPIVQRFQAQSEQEIHPINLFKIGELRDWRPTEPRSGA